MGNWFSNFDTLRAAGFNGFKTIKELRESRLCSVPSYNGDFGVYIVLLPKVNVPIFLSKSTGGRFKKRNPNVTTPLLEKKWVFGTQILYIGKAGVPGKKVTLKSRLKQYLDFGAGLPIGHWGGRYIWHLAGSEKLLVCWKLTTTELPRNVEKRMIAEFAKEYGKLPFANLVG